MATFKVDQIDHVELFVPDRYDAASWFVRVLGLHIMEAYEGWAEDPQGPLMISSDGGNTKLALFEGRPQGTRETAGFHLVAFRVSSSGFLSFLDRLADTEVFDTLGNRVTREDARDHQQAFSIYFCDPWGHRYEITSYEAEEIRKALKG